MFSAASHAQLARWFRKNRELAIDALALALNVHPGEVLHRLGVHLRDLTIVPSAPKARPGRARGRPRRSIDRDAVLSSVRRNAGRLRPVARETQVPRSTLSRFVAGLPKHAWVYGARLNERHGELLFKSGVDPDVARKRGYLTVSHGLMVPIWNERGVQVWSQTRLDAPLSRRQRYRNDRDAVLTIDVNPIARQRVLDCDLRLYVTEGPRKADAAVSRGLACVAFPGVRMLCLDPERWRYIGVEGREVMIVFDSDVVHNPEVGVAERRLAEFLRSLGARVRIVRLPGYRTGLDDFLASGNGESALLERVE